MREAGHEIGLLVLHEDEEDKSGQFAALQQQLGLRVAEGIRIDDRSLVRNAARSVLGSGLFFLQRFESSTFRSMLNQALQAFSPDVVHFDLITMTGYRDQIPRGIRAVASINDSYAFSLEEQLRSHSLGFLGRLYRSQELIRARRYEQCRFTSFDAVHVVSAVDAEYLQKLNPRTRVSVIPNGVDESLFPVRDRTLGRREVAFVGSLSGVNLQYVKHLLENVWPRVVSEVPDAHLRVVGGLGATGRAIVERYQSQRGVEFVGFVPALHDAYMQAGISIVPIDKRCGLINKALEAMAAGHAVVGYESTFSGIPQAKCGQSAIMCSTSDELAPAIIRLMQDRSLLVKIQNEAANLASREYRWSSRKPDFELLYRA